MQVTVMITWLLQEQQFKNCYRMIFNLRAEAMKQPGYICSDTLQSIDDPLKVIVFSNWRDPESWERWKASAERRSLAAQMEKCLQRQPEYEVLKDLKLIDKLNKDQL